MATEPVCGMTVSSASGITYTCPMHPEVVRGEPSRCPKCGMALVPTKA